VSQSPQTKEEIVPSPQLGTDAEPRPLVSLTVNERASRVARTVIEETLGAQGLLMQTVARTIEETRDALAMQSQSAQRNPSALLARLSDVARSTFFLWTQTAFSVQERVGRAAQGDSGGVVLPNLLRGQRALVMATVSTDLFLAYITLRERGRWIPTSVGPEDWDLQHRRGAARVRDAIETLGGVLIKAGQFGSTRGDLLPAPYIAALSTLQDDLPPRAWRDIEVAITNELGVHPEEIFTEIDHNPVASASIAQVHRAVLPGGRIVAVKVQYPDVAELVETDLTALEAIVSTISRIEPDVRLSPITDYLRETMPLELDFTRELASIEHVASALHARTDVVIPHPVQEYSTARVLVMNFVEGIRINDIAAMTAAGLDTAAVATLLVDVYAEQIFRHGVLHADPHPGNLRVQAGIGGPKLVLLDFGLSVDLAPDLVKALGDMVNALREGDFDNLKKALRDAGMPLPEDLDLSAVLQLVGVVLGGDRQNLAGSELGRQLSLAIGSIPVHLILVGRALSLLEGTARQLNADIDMLDIVARYTV